MRLNKECVRDVLLFIEKECVYYDDEKFGRRLNYTSYDCLCKATSLNKYSKYEIYYAVSKLFEGKFIEERLILNSLSDFNMAEIKGLTLKGHDLLDNIRSNKVWQKTKKALEKVGDLSLNIMSQTANETMSAYIKSLINNT